MPGPSQNEIIPAVSVRADQANDAQRAKEFIDYYNFTKTRCRIDKFTDKYERLTLAGAGFIRRAVLHGEYVVYFVSMHLLPGQTPENAIDNFIHSRRWKGLELSYVGVSVPERITPKKHHSSHVHLLVSGFGLDAETQAKIAAFNRDKNRRKANCMHGQIAYNVEGLIEWYLKLEKNLGVKGAKVHRSKDVGEEAAKIAVHGPSLIKCFSAPLKESIHAVKDTESCPAMRIASDAAWDQSLKMRAPYKTGFFRMRGVKFPRGWKPPHQRVRPAPA